MVSATHINLKLNFAIKARAETTETAETAETTAKAETTETTATAGRFL